ncbi:MAG: AAA family ATPase [Candidatus Lokiarchaeota archaeon]|nr:AAA family ATPase [Candidatus Lokiarchaeota archaeon]
MKLENDGEDFQPRGFDKRTLQLDMLDQLRRLREDMRGSKKSNAGRFYLREPLGKVIVPIPQPDFCYAGGDPNDRKPEQNQVVLVFDCPADVVYSGVVISQELKLKKGTAQKGQPNAATLLFGIQLLARHGMDLKESCPVTQIISEESLVFPATVGEIQEIYGIPKEGLNLGLLSQAGVPMQLNDRSIFYRLNPELLKTHTYIGGVPGQGKTVLLKNVIYDLVTRSDELGSHVHAIVFDSQGDLVQVMKPWRESGMLRLADQSKKIKDDLGLKDRGLEAAIKPDDVLFLKPFYVTPTGFQQLFDWKDFGFRSYRIQTGEQLASFMPLLTAKGHELLLSLFKLFSSCVSFFNFEAFCQWFDNNRITEKKGKNIKWFVPNSVETVEGNPGIADAISQRLKALRSLGVFDTVEEIDTELMLNKKLVFILFPRMGGYETLRSIFLMEILKRIYQKKVVEGYTVLAAPAPSHSSDEQEPGAVKPTVGGAAAGQPPPVPMPPSQQGQGQVATADEDSVVNNLIVIDEAHELLPAKPRLSGLSKDFSKYIEQEFDIIAKEGRKHAISLLVATQQITDLNTVVEQNAQTRILFKLAKKDMVSMKLDALSQSLLANLTPGVAVVFSATNLRNRSSAEMRVVPPVFLHCDPAVAKSLYSEAIERAAKEQGVAVRKPVDVAVPPIIKKESADESRPKFDAADFLKEIGMNNLMAPHVTNINGKSVLDVSTHELLRVMQGELRKHGLVGSHYKKVIEDFAVALRSESSIGIVVVGPSGEGKTQLARALVDGICIGGTKAFISVSEGTVIGEIFHELGPGAFGNKDQPVYNLGVVCMSLAHKTFPIIDEANRASQQLWGGPMLDALAGRFVSMPGGQVVQAPRDWKILLTMNPWDLIGTFAFSDALKNRLMTLKVPYADDAAARDVLEGIIKQPGQSSSPGQGGKHDFADVIDAFVQLRHETMKYSPLDMDYHFIEAEEKKGSEDVRLNAISIRVLKGFGDAFNTYYDISKDKKEAFTRAFSVIEGTLMTHGLEQERECIKNLLKTALTRIR